MMIRLTLLATLLLVVCGVAFGARPIDGLTPNHAWAFNQCVKKYCGTELDDAGKQIKECSNKDGLKSCCKDAHSRCMTGHPDPSASKACTEAQAACQVGEYVIGLPMPKDPPGGDRPKADAPDEAVVPKPDVE